MPYGFGTWCRLWPQVLRGLCLGLWIEIEIAVVQLWCMFGSNMD